MLSSTPTVSESANPSQSVEPVFRVWLRRTGQVAKVRVEGPDALAWLQTRLPPGFTCSEPIAVPGTNFCSFRIPLGLSTSFARLQRAIDELPGATLMLDPA